MAGIRVHTRYTSSNKHRIFCIVYIYIYIYREREREREREGEGEGDFIFICNITTIVSFYSSRHCVVSRHNCEMDEVSGLILCLKILFSLFI